MAAFTIYRYCQYHLLIHTGKIFFHGINDLHEEKYLQSRTDEANRKMNGDTDEDHPAPLIVKTH